MKLPGSVLPLRRGRKGGTGMPNSYDVDDILEEIKRKKSAKSAQEHNAQRMKPTAWDRVETPAPVNTPAPEQIQQASSLEGLADFFWQQCQV